MNKSENTVSFLKEELNEWNEVLVNASISEILSFVVSKIPGKKVFSTSFGIEDQLITHYIADFSENIEIFTLDTGRNFEQTYEVFQRTANKYKKLSIKTYFPNPADIEKYVAENGINGFYDSVEKRKQCCFVRKIIPLNEALQDSKVWITGVRAEQSENRQEMQLLEWDEAHQLIKVNPLLHYTLKEVEEEVDLHNIPVNSLYKKGYLSIGCAPCTRALESGEPFRAGRWWWEGGKKECGLHVK
jgi:phosphoadenosine phosphosulfate reductase